MSSTKLTLRMSGSLIKRAKAYARRRGISVSQVVRDYFLLLDREILVDQTSRLPLTYSLRGILKGKNVKENDYKKHLEAKY